jgi:hypothetical protein
MSASSLRILTLGYSVSHQSIQYRGLASDVLNRAIRTLRAPYIHNSMRRQPLSSHLIFGVFDSNSSRPQTNRAGPGKRKSLPGRFMNCQCADFLYGSLFGTYPTATVSPCSCYSADRNGGSFVELRTVVERRSI